MIIGVDIGGTKTQLATFNKMGLIDQTVRFPTSLDYDTFIDDFKKNVADLDLSSIKRGVVAVPGLLDRKAGKLISLGNLPWRDKSIAQDLTKIVGIEKILIENDSKLAGLSEARKLGRSYPRILYLTLSTGINGALVTHNHLAEDIVDMEIGKMPLEYKGKVTTWEDLASGRAFVSAFSKPASEVNDIKVWQSYADQLASGITIACAILQVEAIIFGGGLGQYADKFTGYLEPYLQKLHPNIIKPRLLTKAHYRDESVIYGCLEYANDHF